MARFWRKSTQVKIAAMTKDDYHSSNKRCSARREASPLGVLGSQSVLKDTAPHIARVSRVEGTGVVSPMSDTEPIGSKLLRNAGANAPFKKRSLLCLPIFTGSLVGCCLVSNPLAAQVTPDASLATEVNTNNQVTEITGGTQADSNLFHSFQDFSVATGSTAFFNNGVDISNIISRVTGSNISEINGLIRANGEANLILINPNGINLGESASLDIGGSFLGSTADSIIFEDGTVLNSDLNTQPLLTISAPVGLQLGANSAGIEVSSNAAANPGLAIKPGNTFALVGNGVTFNGGTVKAESGRIELGSVSAGRISMTEIAAGWQLGYAGITQLADLQLLAGSSVLNPNIAANSTGGIQLQGKNITLERSQITAQTLGNALGGNIVVNAAESLSLAGTAAPGNNISQNNSQIVNDVSDQGTGQGGTIDITTSKLDIAPRSFIGSTTFGGGNAGNINLTAAEINIVGTGFTEFQQQYQLGAFNGTIQPGDRNTGIFAGTATTGTAGDINIETNLLNLSEGAIIFNPVFTAGNGGDIKITAANIDLNASALEIGGGLNSQAAAALGNINLITDNLDISNGATAINLTFGAATGGDINIDADSINLRDSPLNSIVGTGIITNTSVGSGSGGDVDIRTNTLNIVDAIVASTSGAILPPNGTVISSGGSGGDIKIQAAESIEASGIIVSPVDPKLVIGSGIGTSTYSPSDGGNLTIDTSKLIIRDGADFSSATFGAGNGGQLTINASDSIILTGITNPAGIDQGGLTASSGDEILNAEARGNAGNISIATPQLTVRDRAAIDVQSFGTGGAGNVTIETNSMLLDNLGTLSATTFAGEGGDITITTDTLEVNRGLINASVLGNGTGGNIEITAQDSVKISGSGFEALQSTFFNPNLLSPEFLASLSIDQVNEGILAASVGDGNAGTIKIQGENIEIIEGGLVATATAGNGAAGSLFLNATDSVLVDSSFVSNNTLFQGEGGDITIDTNRLEVLNGGQITASTLGSGNSGNVTVNAAESATVSGSVEGQDFGSSISVGAQPLPTTTGNGGDLIINTPKLNVSDRAGISVGSSGSGNAGSLQVNADTIMLDDQGIISADTQSGGGGNIVFRANNIIWQGGSYTTATAGGTGNGGNITIDADNLVAVEGSRLIADAFMGMGGNIEIDTQGLFICPTCQVSASSQLGIDGVVDINTLEPTTLNILETRSQLTKPQEEVAVACPVEKGASTSQLVITGRGGLPSRPQEVLNATSIIEFNDPAARQERSPDAAKTTLPAPARDWYQDAQGIVVLTAKAKIGSTNNSAINSADCHTH
jgi:filamentous hemagglutinin family protein